MYLRNTNASTKPGSVSDRPYQRACEPSANDELTLVCNWENYQCSEVPDAAYSEANGRRDRQKGPTSGFLEPAYTALSILAIGAGYGSCLGRLAGLM
jgi:hypothetical protein